MFQPIVNGIRIYMGLKGTSRRRTRRTAGGDAGAGWSGASQEAAAWAALSADVTWDAAYTQKRLMKPRTAIT